MFESQTDGLQWIVFAEAFLKHEMIAAHYYGIRIVARQMLKSMTPQRIQLLYIYIYVYVNI